MRSYSHIRDRTGPLPYVLSPLTSHRITEPRTERPWLAVMIAAAVFALVVGWMVVRGGVVDRTTYAAEASAHTPDPSEVEHGEGGHDGEPYASVVPMAPQQQEADRGR